MPQFAAKVDKRGIDRLRISVSDWAKSGSLWAQHQLQRLWHLAKHPDRALTPRTLIGRNGTNQKIERLLANPPDDWSVHQQVFLIHALRRLDLLTDRALAAVMAHLFASRQTGPLRALIDDASLGADIVRDYYRVYLAAYLCDDSVGVDEVSELYDRSTRSFLHRHILNQLLIR